MATTVPNPFEDQPVPAPTTAPTAPVDEFDLNAYFNQRLGTAGVDKINAVRSASIAKQDSLAQFRQNLAGQGALKAAQEAADAQSWVGKIGLDPNGVAGGALNMGASLASGASRLAGNIGGLLPGAHSLAIEQTMSDEETAAFNRYQQWGSLSGPETMAILNRRKLLPSAAGAKAGMDATAGPTVLEQFKEAEKSRNTANAINNFFDISGVVHQGKRRGLASSLGEDFDAKWGKVTQGWDDSQKGEFIKGAGGIVSGFADLVTQAGKAAVDNPQGVTEYVVENLPQLAVGALGKVGAGVMTAANIGYAVDNYEKGIQEYQKNHDYQLPPKEEQRKMAMLAASLALAEQVGDMSLLKGAKAAEAAVGDAAALGFKSSLKNTLKAGTHGVLSEAATEGYQTYAEGEVTQKPASALDIYTGAVIGGLSGGVLSGGGRGLAEAAKATPEHAAAQQKSAEQTAVFNEAVAKNDPAPYFDQKSPTYDPVTGVSVLYAHNKLESTTPEVKEQNFQQAIDVLSSLEDRHDELLAQRKTATQEEAKALAPEISALRTQIDEGSKLFDQMAAEREPLPAAEEIKAQVEQANSANTEVSAPAAEQVINLSMRHVDTMSSKEAEALADNTDNGLTKDQRDYLRTFSAARQAENQLSTMKKVSQEILYGSPKQAKTQNVGIAQYRHRIASAITADRADLAQRQLGLLTSFAADHADKAQVARQAWSQQGMGAQILKTDAGWKVADRQYSDKEIRQNGGLTLNTARLMQDIGVEAKALAAARDEMTNAIALRFPDAGVQSVSPVVASAPSTPSAIATPSPESTQGQVSKELTDQRVKDLVQPEEVSSGEVGQQAPVKKDKLTAAAEKHARQEQVIKEAAERAAARKAQDTQEAPQPNDTAQPAEAVAQAPAVQVSEAAADKTPTATPAVTTTPQEEASKPFQERNVVHAHMEQKAGKGNGSTRPLVGVPGFLSELKSNTDRALDYLKTKTLTDEQVKAISSFTTQATAWVGKIADSFKPKNKNFRYQDMVQYLVDESGNLTEAAKTAIAFGAYTWVGDNISSLGMNTDKEINAILKNDDKAFITDEANSLLRFAGTRENLVINSLGQPIFQALGLGALASASQEMQPKMISHLGGYALKLLLDEGIIAREFIKGEDFAALMNKEQATRSNQKYIDQKFIKPGPNTAKVAEIRDAVKGSQGILNKLFGAESGLKEPGQAKIPFTQQFAGDSKQGIPSLLKQIMAHENAQPNYPRLDMWQLITQLHPDIALAVAGHQAMDPATTHKANRDSVQAKNDGLAREYAQLMEYFGVLMAQDQLEKPMYFSHDVWVQQRVGIDTNMVNPQTSKLHRRMMARPAWSVEIPFADKAGLENFYLRMAEGLGVKTDKQSNVVSLEAFNALVSQPWFKEAVQAVRKGLEQGGMTEADQKALLVGVQKGGEAMHSLDALVAWAHYEKAQADGKDTFTTQLMGEVDGVTNGPMLSHLLLGAADTVEQMFSLLNRGGFYSINDNHQNYNVWRGDTSNRSRDLYEITAEHMIDAIAQLEIPQATMAAIYTFTGNLDQDDKGAQKARRNIVKTPLTAMVFGSSVKNAVNSMADQFIKSVYATIEAASQSQDETARQNILHSLRELGIKANQNMSLKELMETELSTGEVETLKGQFTDSLGKAVAQTMQQDFRAFINKRRTFNLSANLAFDLYNSVYQGLREQRIAELVKDGTIATNPTTGKPLQDLTAKQEADLRKELQEILPLVHTAFSQESNDLSSGMLAAKIENELSEDPKYAGELVFATPFPDGAKSVRTHAMVTKEKSPGAGTLVKLVHSFDSFISHTAAPKSEVLNIHDAHGAGVGNFQEAAQNLNQSTWEGLLKYSPATQLATSLSRVLQGVAAMQEAGTLPASSQKALQEVLAKYAEEMKSKPGAVLDGMLAGLKDLAYQSDDMKLQAMEQMAHIDQYALEGGQYDVSAQDRKAAKKARMLLSADLTAEEHAALATLSALASTDIKVQTTPDSDIDPAQKAIPAEPGPNAKEDALLRNSPWGELGAAAIASDPYLVAAFNDSPTMTAKQTVKVLRQALAQQTENRSNAFMVRLLDLIEKTVPASTQVQLVTPATPASAVLAGPQDASRGWFVAKGDGQAVYVLSPDFKYSGLTPETLIHELVHASIATTVEAALAEGKGPAHDLVMELETLRSLASEYVSKEGLKGYAAALENIQEFISWGMSNLDFQRNVLNKVSMKSSTTGNKLVTGMKRFIEALTGLLFKGSSKTAQEQMENGMAVLIANASGLFYAAAQSKPKADLILHQRVEPNIIGFTTQEIFDALGQATTPGHKTGPGFAVQLKGLLDSIVSALHGPYGTLMEAMKQNQSLSPTEIFAQELVLNHMPFASQSLAAGFKISEQEAFVLEQVEVTVKAALEANEGHTTMAYQELAKLYQEASTKLKGKMPQALYDFVFKLEQKADGRSDYLARFAALGLAHEETANLLDFATDVRTERDLADMSFFDKLHAVYDALLSWLSRTFTHTFEGQQADEKLQALITQLVGIEAKKRMKIGQQNNRTIEYLEQTLRDLSQAGRDKVEAFGRSEFFKSNANAFIKAAGTMASAVAGDRVELILEGIAKIRDEHFRQRHGLMAGIINEIRGSRPDNVMFHKLLRTSKHIEGTRKDIITNTAKFTLESFDQGGEYLTQEHKAAVSSVFLRTDLASLLPHYSMAELSKLVQNPGDLKKEIANLERQLTGFQNFGHYFVEGAKLLGYFMATNRVAGANLMFNAGNIAKLYGTPYAGRIAANVSTQAEPLIDQITSMYALLYSEDSQLKLAQEVLQTENQRAVGNGVEMILKLHQKLQQQSKDRLFVAGEPLYMKGYTPELYNPYITVTAANDATGELLEQQGYAKGDALSQDKHDPDKSPQHLYVLRDGGMQSHLTGVFSYTGMRSKGSKVHDGQTSLLSPQGIANVTTMQQLEKDKAPEVRDMFRANPGFDPRKVKDAFMAPVLNAQGDVVNYRYMMQASTKDALLERDNRFEHLLGSLAGNIYDKEMTTKQNAVAVQALKDQYDAEFKERHHSYVKISPTSTDPEMREIWRLLPESTKQSVRDIWGQNQMLVRVDLLDINFGYRKLSIADVFEKDAALVTGTERVLYEIGTFLFGGLVDAKFSDEEAKEIRAGRARLRFKQGEDIWQAFVREAKDTMVVKSGVTLMGNISSNLTALYWFGVPIKDIIRHHRVAMKGALAYRKDSEALERINLQLSTGYLPAANQADLERQKIILEDAIARNPVRELIDAGLMPTIVEDVAADDDLYSFKGRFTRKVDEFVAGFNPHVVDTAKTLLITHDTALYKALSYGTQLSDFVARYTLYQHMTQREKNPMKTEEAIQLVSDAFINYDVPSHRLLQYANDMGFIYFSKYYLRIQKVIMHLYRDNPGRALMLLTASHFFDAVPTLMDSQMVHRIGNPFSTGALKYVTSLDELGTVNALMTPFK